MEREIISLMSISISMGLTSPCPSFQTTIQGIRSAFKRKCIRPGFNVSSQVDLCARSLRSCLPSSPQNNLTKASERLLDLILGQQAERRPDVRRLAPARMEDGPGERKDSMFKGLRPDDRLRVPFVGGRTRAFRPGKLELKPTLKMI